MSKLSFRARALDASKPMPIYLAGEIPDLPDFAAINRAVPQMPTGMEKEEECEHHLQRAISAQQAFGHTGELVIPTPEVLATDDDFLDQIFPTEYKAPRQLIHVQPFAMDQDIPDYDMDSEDERWFNLQARKMDITPYLFEEIMDRLEKSSGQQVVTLKEAKLLIKEDDDLIIAVYDYWLNKRLQTQHPLIPQVKTERRDGSTNNNPYVAFRRRTEKMQTRKNRKNDEASYEKMLKLKRDLNRASLLFDMVKRREKTKREHLHLSIEIFEKRYQMGDFSGQILAEVLAMKNHQPAPLVPIRNNKQPALTIKQEPRQATASFKPEEIVSTPRKKREYNKRKHKVSAVQGAMVNRGVNQSQAKAFYEPMSSEEEGLSPGTPPSDQDDENDPDGPYAFKRKRNCYYLAPRAELGGWPWESPLHGGLGHKKYRFCLTTIPAHPHPRTIGFARRRIGRGGRIIFDRAYTSLDEDYSWNDIASVDISSSSSLPISSSSFLKEIRTEWVHFRPQATPQPPPPPPLRCSSGTHCNNNPNSSVPETPKNYPPPPPETQTSSIDLESFQTHQEELFEMQRKQLERLKKEEGSNGQGSSNTSFTSPASSASASSQPLDPASVQFAVSALLNSNEVPSIINSSSPNCVPHRTSAFSLANGPKDERPDHQTVILKSSKDETLERPPPNSFIQITLPHEVSSSQLPACIRVVPSADPVTNGSTHRALSAPKLTLAADLRLLATQHHPTTEHNGEGQLFSYNEESNTLVKVKLENVKDNSGYAADVT